MVLAMTRHEDTNQLGEPGDHRDGTDAGHRATREGTCEHRLERGDPFHEQIAVPEAGPRRQYEDEAGLDEIRGEQQAREERDGQPPVCTRASRSIRDGTSR